MKNILWWKSIHHGMFFEYMQGDGSSPSTCRYIIVNILGYDRRAWARRHHPKTVTACESAFHIAARMCVMFRSTGTSFFSDVTQKCIAEFFKKTRFWYVSYTKLSYKLYRTLQLSEWTDKLWLLTKINSTTVCIILLQPRKLFIRSILVSNWFMSHSKKRNNGLTYFSIK